MGNPKKSANRVVECVMSSSLRCVLPDIIVSRLQPKENLCSTRQQVHIARNVSRLSYRESADELNAEWYGRNNYIHTTVKNRAVAIGEVIKNAKREKTQEILDSNGYDPNTGLKKEGVILPKSIKGSKLPSLVGGELLKTLESCINDGRDDHEQINKAKAKQVEASAEDLCYISIDGVLTTHQKENRKKNIKTGKYINNTNIDIRADNKHYTITETDMTWAFMQLLAVLLENNLLAKHRLVFFSDGETAIKDNIDKFFNFRKDRVLVLDWFHLKKKMTEHLSMSIKGSKEERQNIARDVFRTLWAGNETETITYLQNLPEERIKNQKRFDDMIGYLQRKSLNIACYAVRAKLNLRNSSNLVEKDNDLIVAKRQKNNGTSWSWIGSGANAEICAAIRNGELDYLIEGNQPTFQMVA